MAVFKSLVNIDSDLRKHFREIEKYFRITIAAEMIEEIYRDALNDHVNEKQYTIFQNDKNILSQQITIHGTVDEYEPETIWVKIKNLKEKDLKFLNELFPTKKT